MRILVIGINYTPERTGVAPFTTGLCEHLASQDHQVRVITGFPYYPEWRVAEGYRRRLYQKERINNVEVRRVRHFVPRRPSALLQRLAHDLSFTAHAFLAGLFAGKFDVVYCSCPPPTAGLAAYVLAKLRGKAYVIKLTDLASDAAIATGIMREGWALRLARVLEGFIYRKAGKVVCLCQGFVEKLKARGISTEKLQVIPDWADTDRVYPISHPTTFRKANGISEEQFVVMHTGNMGKKQDLLNVVRAAELSQNVPDLCWLLVGQGEERALVEREIARRKLRNIRLLPLQPAESLAEMYSSVDVLLLNQKAAIRDAVVPSKLLTYMAAGRPVLAAANKKSEAAQQTLRSECGVVVSPEDPAALVEGALSLRKDPPLRQRLGANGRAGAETGFTKAKVLEDYIALFTHSGAAKPEPELKISQKAPAAR